MPEPRNALESAMAKLQLAADRHMTSKWPTAPVILTDDETNALLDVLRTRAWEAQ
jgi:hypothetical protein